jgi:hypothetical protein
MGVVFCRADDVDDSCGCGGGMMMMLLLLMLLRCTLCASHMQYRQPDYWSPASRWV